jgi:hypothetical protein
MPNIISAGKARLEVRHTTKKNMSKSKDILLEQEQDQDKEISAVEEDLHMQLDIFFFFSS